MRHSKALAAWGQGEIEDTVVPNEEEGEEQEEREPQEEEDDWEERELSDMELGTPSEEDEEYDSTEEEKEGGKAVEGRRSARISTRLMFSISRAPPVPFAGCSSARPAVRSGASWKTVGLPNLEDKMDEPYYASLMFEQHCMVCPTLKPSTAISDFYFRIRLCSTCARKQFTSLDKVADLGRRRNAFSGAESKTRYVLDSTIKPTTDKLRCLARSSFVSMLERKGGDGKAVSLIGFVEEKQRENVVRGREDVELTDERWNAALPAIEVSLAAYRAVLIDPSGLNAFVATKKASLTYPDFATSSSLFTSILTQTRSFLRGGFFPSYATSDSSQRDFLLPHSSLFPIRCAGCHSQGHFPSFLEHDCPRDTQAHLNLIEQLKIDEEKVLARFVVLELVGVEKVEELEGVEERLDAVGEAFACRVCEEVYGVGSRQAKERYAWKAVHKCTSHISLTTTLMGKAWQPEEEEDLKMAVQACGKDWRLVKRAMESTRSEAALAARWRLIEKRVEILRQGPVTWTAEEDDLILKTLEEKSSKKRRIDNADLADKLAEKAGTHKSVAQVRDRGDYLKRKKVEKIKEEKDDTAVAAAKKAIRDKRHPSATKPAHGRAALAAPAANDNSSSSSHNQRKRFTPPAYRDDSPLTTLADSEDERRPSSRSANKPASKGKRRRVSPAPSLVYDSPFTPPSASGEGGAAAGPGPATQKKRFLLELMGLQDALGRVVDECKGLHG
ncbi:hypothetical protein JCM8547_007670 [Rhodosporidiobolus lusitaniae]